MLSYWVVCESLEETCILQKGGRLVVGAPFLQVVANLYTFRRVDALNNLTFIGFSFIGFVIIFFLLWFLPRLKAKRDDRSSAQHNARLPRERTGPKRVYKI